MEKINLHFSCYWEGINLAPYYSQFTSLSTPSVFKGENGVAMYIPFGLSAQRYDIDSIAMSECVEIKWIQSSLLLCPYTVVLGFTTTHMVNAGCRRDCGSVSSLHRLPVSVIKMNHPILAEHQNEPSATTSVPQNPWALLHCIKNWISLRKNSASSFLLVFFNKHKNVKKK